MSRFSRAFRVGYAGCFGLGGGWLHKSDGGAYDETITTEARRWGVGTEWGATEQDIAVLAPAAPAVTAARPAPRPSEEARQDCDAAQTLVSFEKAAQVVYSMSQVANYNVEGYIEQMQGVSEETRERLREKFLREPEARTA